MNYSALHAAASAVGTHKLDLEDLADGRIRVVCVCGYRSTGRQTLQLALEAAAHHLRKEVEFAHRNGVSLPRTTSV